ncbi:hypothetical protein A2U01_0077568 [Trifolium medium]|uniref:Uncharacterized protein n=1 Tax=Trifolium medium TaxID=97028 RepID=A0A392T7D7_9FABA|nr:hypothetical protein [Trifolium medium]
MQRWRLSTPKGGKGNATLKGVTSPTSDTRSWRLVGMRGCMWWLWCREECVASIDERRSCGVDEKVWRRYIKYGKSLKNASL